MLRILAYPTKPDRVKQPSLFVFDKVRSSLVNQQGGHDLDFVKLYKSGNRRYTCPIVSPRMQREWETALLDWDLAGTIFLWCSRRSRAVQTLRSHISRKRDGGVLASGFDQQRNC